MKKQTVTPRQQFRCPPNTDLQQILVKQMKGQLSQTNSQNTSSAGQSLPIVTFKNQPAPTDINNNYGYKKYNFFIDSLYNQSQALLSPGEISSDITQLLPSQNSLTNVIIAEIDDFYFPQIYSPVNTPDYFYYRRAYINFVEAPMDQAVFAPNGKQYHFELNVKDINSQAVLMQPIEKRFYFNQQLTSLSSATLQFLSAPLFAPIIIPPSNVIAYSVAGTNPLTFTLISSGYDTTILGPTNSQQCMNQPGIAIFVTNFNSPQAVINTAVNSPNGIFITQIIDNYTFEVGSINGSNLTQAYSCNIYIPKNRVALPIHFYTFENYTTNGVQLVQI